MSEQQDTSFEGFDGSKDDDIKNLLPDTFDVGYDEFPGVEAEFEEMIESYEAYDRTAFRPVVKPQNGILCSLNYLIWLFEMVIIDQLAASPPQDQILFGH